MNRSVRDDRMYNQPHTLAHYARRPSFKWIVLLLAWVLVTAILSAAHLAVLIWVIMAGLIWYAVSYVLRVTPRVRKPKSPQVNTDDGELQFNAPPGWPEPPPGWTPGPSWEPNPAWPPAPPGWRFWIDPARNRTGERHTRNRDNRYNGAGGPRRRDPWR